MILTRIRHWFTETFALWREQFGCPESRIRLHLYGWSMGPDAVMDKDGLVLKEPPGNGWWLYCIRCHRRLWADDAKIIDIAKRLEADR